MLKSLQNDLIILLVLLGAAGVLTVLLVRDLGAGLPGIPTEQSAALTPNFAPPLPDPGTLFTPRSLVSTGAQPARLGFQTTHFQPAPAPPRQPPTTRKVEFTYLGFVQAGDGPRLALLLESKAPRTVAIGSNLIADIAVAAIERQSLVVTNAVGATNTLKFREKAALEVPAQ